MTSLGNKITAYLLTAIVVVMALEGYLSFQRVRTNLLTDIRREMVAVSRIVRAALESVSEAALEPHFDQLVTRIHDTGNIWGFVLYNRGGQVVTLSPSLQGHALPQVDIVRVIASRTSVEEIWHEGDLSRYYRLEPILNARGEGIAGILLLQDPLSFRAELYERMLSVGGTTLGLLVLLATIISLVARRSVARPLRTFTQHIERLGQGHGDLWLHTRRHDELGRLAQEIDRLWGCVEEARRQTLTETAEKLRLERMLHQSEKLVALGQLASRLAHEIGTPLNIIKGRAQQLQQRASLTEKERSFLAAIVSQIERISRFIRQLLTLARRPEPRLRAIAINDVVRRSWEVIGDRGTNPGVEITLDLADNLPPILGDPDQLQEVLFNLTTNAIQTVGATGQVILSTRSGQNGHGAKPQTVEIVIRDTGSGIAPDDLPHVFDPFFTTKSSTGGSGLGLPISREIVRSHFGEISVTSEPGHGACVVVALPVADRQQEYVPQPAVIVEGQPL
jgi:signal transduction histidine kinase